MKRIATFIGGFLALLASEAHAGTREDVMSGMERCAVITDDRIWLDCLYGAAQPIRSKLGLPPAPGTQTMLVPPRSSVPAAATQARTVGKQSSGGFFSYLFGGERIVDRIPLASYRFDARGVFTITLANGQVWQQTDDSRLAHWRGPASSYIASITKGAADTANLTIVDDAVYKVHRVQ